MAETKKNIKMQQLKQDSNGNFYYETMHPETVSEQVKYEGKVVGAAGAAGTKYSTTKGALDSIVDHINNNVDGVSQAHGRIDALEAKVNEAGQAIVYDDALGFAELSQEASDKYRVGTQILIVDTNSPDYWISKVFSSNMGFTSTEIGPGGYFYCGYYGVSILEVAVDLAPYQKKYDVSLATTNKEVAPAINEVLGKVNSAQVGVDTNTDTLKGIVEGKDGTYTTVGKANYANTAGTAGEAVVAERARELETPVELKVIGDISGSSSFTGASDVEIRAELKATGVTAGTYSAVTVDTKGRVTAGTQFIEVGEGINDDASAKLPTNGIFFRRVA